MDHELETKEKKELAERPKQAIENRGLNPKRSCFGMVHLPYNFFNFFRYE